MKYVQYLGGVFLFLLAQSLLVAQPAYEDVSPFLTGKTVSVTCTDLSSLNFQEILSKLQEAGQILLPQTMAESTVQTFFSQADSWADALQERLEAAREISGGYMYVIQGEDGMCWIFPVNNSNAQAETKIANLLKDFPYVKTENEDLQELALQFREKISVTQTADSIVFYISPENLVENEDEEEDEDAPETLDEYLKGVAPRPDFAAGFEKARFGKYMTLLAALPLTAREELEFPENPDEKLGGSPLTEKELYDLIDSFQGVALVSDSICEFSSIQFVFKSEESAEKALSTFQLLPDWVKEDLASQNESLESVTDFINYLFPAITPEQNGSVLVLESTAVQNKIAAPILALFENLTRYQTAQREKFKVDAQTEANRQYEFLKPWLSEETFLVSRVDLERFTPSQWFETLKSTAEKLLPETMKMEQVTTTLEQVGPLLQMVDAVVSELKAKGAKELYVTLDSTSLGVSVRIFLPNVTINEGADPEKVAFLTASDLLGESEALKPLSAAANLLFVFGQQKNTVVVLPKCSNGENPAEATWELLMESRKPVEIPMLRDALELNAQCGFSVVFRNVPTTTKLIKQYFKNAREQGENLSVPSSKFIENGLGFITLGVDPNLGLCGFNILSKTKKSAQNVQKLVALWKQELIQSFEKSQQPEQSEVLNAFITDYVDFLFSLLTPVRDGNRLYWDLSRNERLNYLRANVPAPIWEAGGVGFLAGLTLPAVQQARQAARTMQTKNNYKMIALAMLNHEATFMTLPPAYTVDENGKPLHSWRVLILPFMEENALYSQIRLDEPWDSEWNSQFHDQCPKVFQSVFNPAPSEAVVGVVVGKKTLFPPVTKKGRKGTRLGEIKDGTSNTLLLVPCKPVCWMDPTGDPKFSELQSPADVVYDGSDQVFPIVTCDCAVNQIPFTFDATNWLNLLKKDDGNTVSFE